METTVAAVWMDEVFTLQNIRFLMSKVSVFYACLWLDWTFCLLPSWLCNWFSAFTVLNSLWWRDWDSECVCGLAVTYSYVAGHVVFLAYSSRHWPSSEQTYFLIEKARVCVGDLSMPSLGYASIIFFLKQKGSIVAAFPNITINDANLAWCPLIIAPSLSLPLFFPLRLSFYLLGHIRSQQWKSVKGREGGEWVRKGGCGSAFYAQCHSGSWL